MNAVTAPDEPEETDDARSFSHDGRRYPRTKLLGEWLAADHDHLSDSLARFFGTHPYGAEMLRHDLARFRHLLGDDLGVDFLPRRGWRPPS